MAHTLTDGEAADPNGFAFGADGTDSSGAPFGVAVAIPQNALPAGTEVLILSGDPNAIASDLPNGGAGAQILDAFAVAWKRPTAPADAPAAASIGLAIADNRTNPNDTAYMTDQNGAYQVDPQALFASDHGHSGFLYVFQDDPAFVVTAPANASAPALAEAAPTPTSAPAVTGPAGIIPSGPGRTGTMPRMPMDTTPSVAALLPVLGLTAVGFVNRRRRHRQVT